MSTYANQINSSLSARYIFVALRALLLAFISALGLINVAESAYAGSIQSGNYRWYSAYYFINGDVDPVHYCLLTDVQVQYYIQNHDNSVSGVMNPETISGSISDGLCNHKVKPKSGNYTLNGAFFYYDNTNNQFCQRSASENVFGKNYNERNNSLNGIMDLNTVAGVNQTEDMCDHTHGCTALDFGVDLGTHLPLYYGYYSGANSVPIASYMNTAWIAPKDLDDLKSQLAVATQLGQYVILNLTWNLPQQKSVTGTGDTFNVNWMNTFGKVIAGSSNIKMLYVADEPSITDSNIRSGLESNISFLNAAFPSLPTAIAYSVTEIDKLRGGTSTHQWTQGGDANAAFPKNVTTIGFDFYYQGNRGTNQVIDTWYAEAWRLDNLLARLKANISDKQNIILFPDAAVALPVTPSGRAASPSRYLVDQITGSAGYYFQLASKDPQIVGLLPFIHTSFREGSVYWLGASDLTRVAAQHKHFGKCVKYGK